MNNENFRIVKSVIRSYFKSLTGLEVRQWAVTSGRFLVQNKKLIKGDKYNVGLELLPSNLCGVKGVNLCGRETACIKTCLVFTGKGNLLHQRNMIDNGKISPILATRARRTWLYLNDTEFFYDLLDAELVKARMTADLLGKRLAVRLNVFSDIDWTPFIRSHQDIQFYDYTKYWNRRGLANYHLTYSYNEGISLQEVKNKLDGNHNVAVVFSGKLPETWNGYEVTDGDVDDNRYDDAKGVVIGLAVKKPIGKKEEDAESKFLLIA